MDARPADYATLALAITAIAAPGHFRSATEPSCSYAIERYSRSAIAIVSSLAVAVIAALHKCQWQCWSIRWIPAVTAMTNHIATFN